METTFATWQPTTENEIALKNALSIQFTKNEIEESDGDLMRYIDDIAHYYAEGKGEAIKEITLEALSWVKIWITDAGEPNREETLDVLQKECISLYNASIEKYKKEMKYRLELCQYAIKDVDYSCVGDEAIDTIGDCVFDLNENMNYIKDIMDDLYKLQEEWNPNK